MTANKLKNNENFNILEGNVKENDISLTEQWKNGELELGAYYVNYQYNNRVWLYRDRSQTPDNTVGLFEVLAPVPSYDHFVDLTEKVKENDKLKELLKESKIFITRYKDLYGNLPAKNIVADRVLDKIDEVLK